MAKPTPEEIRTNLMDSYGVPQSHEVDAMLQSIGREMALQAGQLVQDSRMGAIEDLIEVMKEQLEVAESQHEYTLIPGLELAMRVLEAGRMVQRKNCVLAEKPSTEGGGDGE
jgi:hypothetical protein